MRNKLVKLLCNIKKIIAISENNCDFNCPVARILLLPLPFYNFILS